ncbi:MAG: hypothetical protein RR191_03745 [Cetobacterium sp.]|uniref:hypothetical protein n=1 Tax=Cetobacterium sp. TaxID=2071632 RepID=UPI002FC79BFB
MKKLKKKYILFLAGFILFCFGAFSLYKVSPRNYMTDKVILAYVDEEITSKDLRIVDSVLKRSNIKGINLENFGKYLDGVYIISKEKYLETKKRFTVILDPGYMLPFFYISRNKYFNKDGDMYVLKPEYKERYKDYLGCDDIYLLIHRGNVLLSTRDGELRDIVDNEMYVDDKLNTILDKGLDKKLGIFLINLDRTRPLGFKGIYLTGDLNNENFMGELVIEGKSPIISALSKTDVKNQKLIELDKNKLHFYVKNTIELKYFLSFSKYFLQNNKLESLLSNITLNEKALSSKENENNEKVFVKFEKNQFLYGKLASNKLNSSDIDLGEVEIKGYGDKKQLVLKLKTTTDDFIKILNYIKVGGQE